jgi:hypothetical protein
MPLFIPEIVGNLSDGHPVAALVCKIGKAFNKVW